MNREVAAMALAAVAVDLDQTLDVLAHFTAKVTLDRVVLLDVVADANELFICKVARTRSGVDAGRRQELAGAGRADAIDVAQGDLDALLVGGCRRRKSSP